MIYLSNITSGQTIFIPRNDSLGSIHKGSYEQGFEDGFASGETHQKNLLSSITFTENGEFERADGWSAVTVSVPTGSTAILEEKSVTISADTTVVLPSSGFDGMSAVTIDASEYAQSNYEGGFEDGYQDGFMSGSSEGFESGYTSGHTDGVNEEKAKLSATTFTANTAVTISDGGYSAITVNVPQTGASIPLSSITITENTAITETEKAYSAITVNVPHTGHTDQELEEAYESGHTEGMNDQKELLSSTTLTINGTYQREAGWSAVTVDVSGSTVKLESKNYSLYNDAFDPTFGEVISPSSGYDGLSQVIITDDGYSQVKYEQGYADGQGSMAGEYQRGFDDGFVAGSSQGFIGGVDSTVYGAYYPIESVGPGPSHINRSYKTQITQFSGVGTTFEFHFTNLGDASWPYGMFINGYGDNFYLKYESTESADTKAYIIYVSDGNGNSNTLRILPKDSNNIVGYLTITQEGCEYGLGSTGIITSTASTPGDFASVLFSILFNPETKYNIVFNRMRVIANGTVQKEFIFQNGDIVDVVNNATATTYDYSGNTVTGVFQPRLVSYPRKVLNS